MLWLETDPMTERLQFVQDALSDRFTMAEVCARYGVSRKTGYKWIARYAEQGRRGLGDRSRAPHTCPHKLSETVTALLVATREAHRSGVPASCWRCCRRSIRACGNGRRRAPSPICSRAAAWSSAAGRAGPRRTLV